VVRANVAENRHLNKDNREMRKQSTVCLDCKQRKQQVQKTLLLSLELFSEELELLDKRMLLYTVYNTFPKSSFENYIIFRAFYQLKCNVSLVIFIITIAILRNSRLHVAF
jgi:hypothetical protein